MFGVLYAAEGSSTEILREIAQEFSPRIEVTGAREIALDLGGLTRLFGDPREMGEALCRTAAERGVRLRLAIAGTRTTARLLARAEGGPLTVVAPGTEAAALARLPLDLLSIFADDSSFAPSHLYAPAPSHSRPPAPSHPAPSHPRTLASRTFLSSDLLTFRRWGLRTLGDVAALPSDAVASRLGQQGVEWQRLAQGVDPRPLLPGVPEERFEQAIDLEWPIEGLEPLSFVLGRLMEPLSAHLERRGRGAAVLHVRLHLVTRALHQRTLELPTPMRDARTLRTLALLDLESHPPDAAIDRVCVAVEPTPARDLQYSLLTRPLPSPEQLSTLMARLNALMGEGRCGSPAVVDSWRPGAFAMTAFKPGLGARDSGLESRSANPESRAPNPGLRALSSPEPRVPSPESVPPLALRRFRHPVPTRVRVEQGKPVSVGSSVRECAGPWRTTGDWWTDDTWDRDEWDVTLSDGVAYRVFRDRRTDAWFVEGVVD